MSMIYDVLLRVPRVLINKMPNYSTGAARQEVVLCRKFPRQVDRHSIFERIVRKIPGEVDEGIEFRGRTMTNLRHA